jgi:hypothetical protein
MNYSTLSLSALKVLALENNAIPTGDKRAKQSWIDALELFAASETIPDLSDSQMECHAVEVDMAKEIIDRLEELSIEPDNEAEAEFEARSGEYIGLSEVLGDIQTEIKAQKKGAATVFSALLVILILAIQSVVCIGYAVVRVAIHLKNLFGSYNPDYDLFGQLNDMVRRRKLDIASA